MRDYLPSDVRKREYVIGIIKEVYESYGFEPLETPAVENLETLTGKYGEEGNQLIFKILKRGEKLKITSAQSERDLTDLALRYDLTVPLARVVANRQNELPKFFKRYQIQPVWRADRPARGRFREFYQCDVDAIGSTSIVVETELISAVAEILTRLGFQDFFIRVNHRALLSGRFENARIPEEKFEDALIAIDKMDKIGIDGVKQEFLRRGIDDSELLKMLEDESVRLELAERVTQATDDFDKAFTQASYTGIVFKRLRDEIRGNEKAEKGLQELEAIKDSLPKRFRQHFKIDPTLARGLSYYTGTIMEINVPDLAGSLGGGGRYDALIGMFGKQQIPACGFSLGLERILVVMEERGMFPPQIAESCPADVMITIMQEDDIGGIPESLKLAAELRSAGLRVTVYPEADKLGKQFKYADSIRVPWVCVLGETESATGKVTVKNLVTGVSGQVDRSEVAAYVLGE